jgi:hypothetical protein
MANQFTYQVLKDTNTHTVIKFTGFFDGASGEESNAARVAANSLYGALDSSKGNLLSSVANTGANAYYGLAVSKVWWTSTIPSPGHLNLYWTSDTGPSIMKLTQGTGAYNDNGNMITIPNNSRGQANSNGNIGFYTHDANVSHASYTVVMELRKDNYDYSRGQDRDPGAFNYGPGYTIRP